MLNLSEPLDYSHGTRPPFLGGGLYGINDSAVSITIYHSISKQFGFVMKYEVIDGELGWLINPADYVRIFELSIALP